MYNTNLVKEKESHPQLSPFLAQADHLDAKDQVTSVKVSTPPNIGFTYETHSHDR